MQNQILNAVVQKLAIAPASPQTGQIYFNTASNRMFYYNGTEWIGTDALGASMTGGDIVTAINAQGDKISLLNIDVSKFTTSKDGLVPKASTGGDTGKFLKGDGTWATPTDTVVPVINNLTSTSTTSALSANQGKILKDELDKKETITGATSKASTAEANAKGYADTVASTAEANAKSYTNTKVADLVGSAPETLDTLKVLADALGGDANFATTITNEISKKADKKVQAVGNGSVTSFDVTHNFNTRDVVVLIRETGSPYAQVFTDVEMTTENKITVKFAKAPTSNQYTVTVVG